MENVNKNEFVPKENLLLEEIFSSSSFSQSISKTLNEKLLSTFKETFFFKV